MTIGVLDNPNKYHGQNQKKKLAFPRVISMMSNCNI